MKQRAEDRGQKTEEREDNRSEVPGEMPWRDSASQNFTPVRFFEPTPVK